MLTKIFSNCLSNEVLTRELNLHFAEYNQTHDQFNQLSFLKNDKLNFKSFILNMIHNKTLSLYLIQVANLS